MKEILINLIRDEFRSRISEKNSWGKNEVTLMMEETLSKCTSKYVDIIEEQKQTCKCNHTGD